MKLGIVGERPFFRYFDISSRNSTNPYSVRLFQTFQKSTLQIKKYVTP